MSAKNITIEDVGPIKRLDIPLPESYGLVVLRGLNGLGKTTALNAIDTAVRGKGQLSLRRGAALGSVDCLGIKIGVRATTRRSGELEVETLEGKLSVSDLVDPQIADPDAADRRRIKAILHVTGYDAAEAPPDFRSLVSNEVFDRVVRPDSMKGDDPVEMAARVKRDFEAEAKRLEGEAEKLVAEGNAITADEPVAGIDEAIDIEAARKRVSDAHSAVAVAKAGRKAFDDHASYIAKCRDELDAVREDYSGVSIEEAALDLADADARVVAAQEGVRAAEESLRLAKSVLEQEVAARDKCVAFEQAARSHARVVEGYEKILNGTAPPEVTHDQIEALQSRVDVCEGELERLKELQQEHDNRKRAAELRRKGAEKLKDAANLRTAARATDDVLTDLVAKCGVPLTVRGGRLIYTDQDGNRERLFHELSDGEGYLVGIGIAIEAARKLGSDRGVLIPLEQRALESLSPRYRAEIDRLARDSKAWIVSALATDDEQIVVAPLSEASEEN